MKRKSGTEYLKALIVQNEQLQDPIAVFRSADGATFTALLMRCTHQGNQLQLYGERFQCAAHGSEFDMMGHVKQGPAEDNLRQFPAVIEQEQLKISLK